MITIPHYAKYIYLMHISRNYINNVNNNKCYNGYRPAIPFVYPDVVSKSLHH